MKLEVPYYSQFVDVSDSFWMLRACGAVCMKSVMEYHGKVVPDIISLCNEAKEKGGYHMSNGWVHDYLVTRIGQSDLEVYRKEGIESLDEIYTSLDQNNPVIVSVEKRVLEQTRFHLVTLVGYEELNGVRNFYYHESESTDKEKGKYHMCDEKTFLEYFRGKAIFVSI